MYYTYVLLSKKDNHYYSGYTINLRKRFLRHSNGDVLSTKFRRPLKLVYYEACLNEKDAIRREKFLKSGKGKLFLNKRLKIFLKNK